MHDSVKEHARTPFREATWRQLSEGIRFVQGTFDDDDAFDRLARDRRGARHLPRHGRQPRVLPLGPAERVPGGLQAAGAVRPLRSRTTGPGAGSSSRSRSATTCRARASSTRSSRACSGRTTSSGSTTTSARRRCRTSWRCASPTSSTSPSGTRNYVDHVQITMAEDIGIGGRAGYYDGIGAARDVIQNHLLQLLALTAMEEPASFEATEPDGREDQGPLRRPAAPRPRQAHRPRPVRGRLAGRREGRRATSRRRASTRSPPPRRSPRSASTSTTAAGPGCRSTCARASGWAVASRRSPWCSSVRRTSRSSRPPRRSWARTPWSSACSPTRA